MGITIGGPPLDLQDKIHKLESEKVKELIKIGVISKNPLSFLSPARDYVIQTFSLKIPVNTKKCFIQYNQNSPHEVFFSEDNGKTYNYVYSSHIDIKLASEIPGASI